jgi:hypothetical protein
MLMYFFANYKTQKAWFLKKILISNDLELFQNDIVSNVARQC